ncbi:MAG: DNRLRE domain-containing protein [Bacillota bacterium]
MAVVYLTPEIDTYVYNQLPDENFSFASEMLIGYSKPDNIYRSILKFGLENIHMPAYINKGIMRLYLCANEYNFTKCIDVHTILTPYDGHRVTYNTQPQYGVPYDSSAVLHSEKCQFIEWNLTELVRGWHSGRISNNGILLKTRTEKQPGLVSFASKDNSYKPFQPHLLLDYCQKDVININAVYTVLPIPAYTEAFNTVGCSMASFFVMNQGCCDIKASLEVSPDSIHWFEEENMQIVHPEKMAVLVPRIYGRYTRLKFFSEKGRGRIQVYMQGQG